MLNRIISACITASQIVPPSSRTVFRSFGETRFLPVPANDPSPHHAAVLLRERPTALFALGGAATEIETGQKYIPMCIQDITTDKTNEQIALLKMTGGIGGK